MVNGLLLGVLVWRPWACGRDSPFCPRVSEQNDGAARATAGLCRNPTGLWFGSVSVRPRNNLNLLENVRSGNGFGGVLPKGTTPASGKSPQH
jgi:hypothetical protein